MSYGYGAVDYNLPIHYAARANVVEKTCREFKVKYTALKTFLAGLASHFRWLRRMGMPVTA